ncbi:nitrile hydratase accessory protein [Lutimaribacter sp. EGI FJ00015]|uniref:Nitrile hydratase accessory protein n=1 Tax=Lutimaribacter degradans TaxID=2945989 RepID=A0ACC5ZTF9_9RHOB|nr:nitrile hydratase accessory protein [Lutimaribacter sp. EGI FJ00013]MCM2561420.1 nitrile hydratase accessory protein [Lutimaribacter sp. EGI FJ00013]MCO0612870.1 nitrile hydratase accessory protein [Lutimaribacter sp. EGI FJ00015]MCO0635528.1 nitrile hydratase accessory protein [Lutimaribacter sp. EGI FJ00014]
MSDAPKTPVFSEPWHAQLFALTVHLHERDVFTWPDWAARFGATLAEHGLSKELDGGDDYFNAWLAALEGLLSQRSLAEAALVQQMRDAWEAAYMRTPHGDPVRLA